MSEFCAIILGGEAGDSRAHYAQRCRSVVCADAGAEQARRLGIRCDVILGDLDSVRPDTRSYYEALGTNIIHVPDQDHTDFEKALDYLSHGWSGEVLVFGLTGGRLDHTLSNLSIMLRYSERFTNLRAIDNFGEYQFLAGTHKQCLLACPEGTTISLIPFGEANGVVTSNLLYPLRMESLALGAREGISNRATGSPVRISIEGGALLVAQGHT